MVAQFLPHVRDLVAAAVFLAGHIELRLCMTDEYQVVVYLFSGGQEIVDEFPGQHQRLQGRPYFIYDHTC